MTDKIKLLLEAKPFIQMVKNGAESLHDDPDSEMHMDLAQYELIRESERLLSEIEELEKTLCEAPGCTRKKRNPYSENGTYCSKHRSQIKKHGRLRPDLERSRH